MNEVERRIFVSEDILLNEFSYVYGDNKDKEVTFTYYRPKTDKESKGIQMTYREALSLARSRANDGRYKNFEFLIG